MLEFKKKNVRNIYRFRRYFQHGFRLVKVFPTRMVSFDLRRSLKYRSRDFFGAFMERSNEFFENSIEKVIESTFE